MTISARFDEALTFASELHRKQVRKGVDTPYVAHLLSVAGLVLEYGGDEEQAIAALLHDAIEDQAEPVGGVEALRARIREHFGDEVRRIVDACTDAEVTPKPPWRERKEAYLKHLAEVDERVALVSCCDKLHNLRAVVADYRLIGDALFDRFNAGRDGVMWYYRELARTLDRAHPSRAATELRRTYDLLASLVAAADVERAGGQARGAPFGLERLHLGPRVPGSAHWAYYGLDGTLVVERFDHGPDGDCASLLEVAPAAQAALADALGVVVDPARGPDRQALLLALTERVRSFTEAEALFAEKAIDFTSGLDTRA